MPMVLVVEDEELIRWSLRQRLESAGYGVVDAADARTASRRSPEADLVVLDRGLPDADGLAVAATLHRRRPKRPMILMTSIYSRELEEAAEERGVAYVVQKPFELDELVDLVRSALGGR
jgi:DNA-binding NtrC family response regulator